MSQLDRHSSQLMKVFKKKGGTAGCNLGLIMAAMDKDPTVETRWDCVLKALCVYMNESSESFIKEYLEVELPTTQMEPMVLELYLVKQEGAEPGEPLVNVGVIIEGVGVLRELKYLANGWAVLLGLI